MHTKGGSKPDVAKTTKDTKEHRNTTKSTITKVIKAFEKNIAENSKTNNKKYWKYVNSKLKTRSKVPDLKLNETVYTKSELEKVDLLNHFFTSVFTSEDLSSVPQIEKQVNEPFLTSIDITEEMTLEILKSLNPSKSIGPDGIHPRILKETSDILAFPLHLIFRSSLQHGMIPNEWKIAHVTPVHKKGSKHSKENYRPISLTSIVCRVMERILKNKIVDHLERNDLLSNEQYGFRSKRSCVLQLLETLEEWTSCVDRGKSLDVIYFDFAKAFDSVLHKRLLSKMHSYGIRGNILNWIEQFLSGRKQRVVLNGFKSPWSNVQSGVPQGSVLGPLLFLIHVNDIPKCAKSSKVKMFADDLKLFSTNTTSNNDIQQDISSIEHWSDTWQLPLNKQKCSYLRVSSSNNNDPKNVYYLHHENLQTSVETDNTDNVKDLGVIVDETLKFEKQISERIKKANSVLSSIKRTIRYMDKSVFTMLYKSIVRPILEFCGAVWNPHLVKQIKSIESVQRRATKLVPIIKQLSYKDRLTALKLPTLEYRRKRGDMILTYKILKNHVDTNPSLFFKMNNCSRTRGQELKLFKSRSCLDVRKYVFSNRIVEDWNKLPNNVIQSPSVKEFEKRYDACNYANMYIFSHA